MFREKGVLFGIQTFSTHFYNLQIVALSAFCRKARPAKIRDKKPQKLVAFHICRILDSVYNKYLYVSIGGILRMNKDLTVGKPSTVLWKFCLPLFGSIIFQQLYNIADSWVAGKFINENALAAVGNSYEITLVFIAFAFGCNMGCSVLVSTLFGSKLMKEMKTAISTAMLTSAAICAVLMVIGLVACDGLLALIQTPAEVFADSKLYLDIYIWSLPFLFFYNIATGIFSALGDSKTPFWFLAVSSTANVGMDILFVAAFQMGVAGVAWATFLCQGVSCVLSLVVVFRRLKKVETAEKAPLFSTHLLKRFLSIAVPSTLQQSFVSVGNIIIQGFINGFGTAVMAGYSAAIKLNNLVITSFATLGNGISNYTAQNMGAGKPERVHEGFKAGVKMVWVICVPVLLLYTLCGNALINFFIENPTQEALKNALQLLHIVTPFYFVVSVKIMDEGILRGAGFMKPFMVATFFDLALRVILAGALSATALGSLGIWIAWPIGWCLATALSLFLYSRCAKRDFRPKF